MVNKIQRCRGVTTRSASGTGFGWGSCLSDWAVDGVGDHLFQSGEIRAGGALVSICSAHPPGGNDV